MATYYSIAHVNILPKFTDINYTLANNLIRYSLKNKSTTVQLDKFY